LFYDATVRVREQRALSAGAFDAVLTLAGREPGTQLPGVSNAPGRRIQRRCVSANQKREHDLILDGRSLEPLKYGFGMLGACLKQIAGQKHLREEARDRFFTE
jgi:hypothetical protein